MSANKRYPYWSVAVVVLAAALFGLHLEAFANGTNAVGNAARTLRDGGAGCTAESGCHLNKAATVTITRGATFVLPGQSTQVTVTAKNDTVPGTPLRMGMDVATKKDAVGTNGTLSESASNLLAVNSAEVVHCTATASGCSLGSLATTNASGSASYTVTFTMPANAVAGDTHTLYATARLGLGQSGGSWNHASSVKVTAAATPNFTGAPPNGTVGVLYNYAFTATGTPAPEFQRTGGSLPTGLTLVNGVLSGTPGAVGTFVFTVRASNGVLPSDTKQFSVTIADAATAPSITSTSPPATGTVGVPYNHTYTATGNPAPAFALNPGSGPLPTGLTLQANGVLSGTPTTDGTFSGTVKASNGVGSDATQPFTITVAAAPAAPNITSAPPPATGTVGVPYSHTYTATGNPAPAFALNPGSGPLPTGLTLQANGVLSGTPTTDGTFSGTVRATNGVSGDALQPFTITIAAAPAVPNYQALWWKPTESGWGINLTHQGEVIFATWFTFGTDNAPQWFTMVARNTPAEPNVYSSPISSFSGPPFNTEPFPPNANVRTQVGTGKLTFAADGKSATFEYTVNGISQVKQIVPQELFPGQGLLPACAFGTALADLPLATNYQSLWWATLGSDLGGDESGWGINFTHHGNVIFATWFTYDVNGKGWWLFSVASLTAVPGVYAGNVRTAAGPAFSAEPWDPNAVVRTTVGTTTLTFTDGNHATFAYTVNGVVQTKALVRQLFDSANGTVCN